jgi:predicted  nucleic acid-binding Zn-ribbon protein
VIIKEKTDAEKDLQETMHELSAHRQQAEDNGRCIQQLRTKLAEAESKREEEVSGVQVQPVQTVF